jgi:hypothetical protein
MCWDAIVDLYERHARDFDRDRGRTLQKKAWLDKFLSRVRPSGVVFDPECGEHTVWLAKYGLDARTQ